MGNKQHIRFDWAIKRLLRNKANFGILEGFLSELLKNDIRIQEILESESNKTSEDSKFNRVDILVKDHQDNYMLIEVQNEKQDDYFHRMVYGQAKLISERLDSGDLYEKLTLVYSINIVYFPLGVGSDYIYKSDGNFVGIHNNDILTLTDKQKELYKVKEVREIFTQYYILKVNAFDDIAKDTLDEWIYFLKNSEIKDDFTAQGLSEAKETLRIDNLPPAEKEEYEVYIKTERIRESEIRTAFSDGVFETEQKYTEELNKAQAQAEKERQEKEKAEAQAEKERQEKEKERQEKEKAEAQAEKERQEKEAAQAQIKQAIKIMAKSQIPIAVIAQSFGKSEDEISQILGE